MSALESARRTTGPAAVCLALASLALASAARADDPIVWPVKWTAFGPVPIEAKADGWPARGAPDAGALLPGSALTSIPDTLRIGGVALRGQAIELDTEGRINLAERFGGAVRGHTVYLLAELVAPRAVAARLGAGANWYMQWWLNGERVYDTLATGNKAEMITTANHTFELSLRAGTNVLAVAVISGSGGFKLAVGNPDSASRQPLAEARAKLQRARLAANEALAAEAVADLRRAAELGAEDPEKAAALLALAEACQTDPHGAEGAALRRIYEQVLALGKTGSRQKDSATIGLGDTWRAERQFERARELYARVSQASPNPTSRREARLAAARAHLAEGHTAAARETLEALVADQPGARKEANSLLEVVRLAEIRAASRQAWRVETGMDGSADTLIERLQDRDPRARARAAAALGDARDPRAVAALAAALRDNDQWEVRREAAAALGRIGDPGGARPLVDALVDSDWRVRLFAESALTELPGAAAVPLLLERLRDADGERRAAAADGLGRLGARQALDPLLAAMPDGDARVRRAAARALGAMPDPRAVEPLARALREDGDSAVRRLAAVALDAIADPRAFAPLIKALDDDDSAVRITAAESVGRHRAAGAVEPLIRQLDAPDPMVARTAVMALARLKARPAVPRLVQLAQPGGNLLISLPSREALTEITGDRTVRWSDWAAWWEKHKGEYAP